MDKMRFTMEKMEIFFLLDGFPKLHWSPFFLVWYLKIPGDENTVDA
jgi:hypothetical protein